MKIFFHFLRRDTASNLFAWVLLASVHVAYVFFRLVAANLPGSGLALGFAYLVFALVYVSAVWDSGQWSLAAIRRSYLQCLPVERSRLFWICYFRAAFGSLPLWIYLLLTPSFPFTLAFPGWAPYLGMTWAQRVVLAILSLLALMSVQLVFCNIYLVTERIQRIASKSGRFLQYARWSLVDTVLTFAAIAFCGLAALWIFWDHVPTPSAFLLACVGIGYLSWQVRTTYRNWLGD